MVFATPLDTLVWIPHAGKQKLTGIPENNIAKNLPNKILLWSYLCQKKVTGSLSCPSKVPKGKVVWSFWHFQADQPSASVTLQKSRCTTIRPGADPHHRNEINL